MEVYRGTNDSTVVLPAPSTVTPVGSIDIKAVNYKGDVLHDFATVTRVPEGFSVSLPWSLTRQDNSFTIKWKFSYIENSETFVVEEETDVNVVTPILPLTEVASLTGFTDIDDIVDIERRVRFAIQTNTGTTFGKFHGTIPVQGAGDEKLTLPLPILRVDSPTTLNIYGGGWMLGSGVRYFSGGIKACPPDNILDQFAASSGPIMAPWITPLHWFAQDITYEITGIWGYKDIPEDVKQAARLLIVDYACDESLWRERYINAIKAGDWRIDFNAAAFTGTGNVSVDQILAAYRRTNLVTI